MVRTLDVDGCNSKDLIRIILRDLGLTAQVLRVANSIMYNHSDRPILSIAHATTLLGWLQVRNMVGTAQEIEQFAKHSPGLPELLLGSVLTAVQSRDVAAVVGYPRPEEAYICGLFRNLGEVLMGCHFPNEYSTVLVAMEKDKIPERAACFRVHNFSWEDLGMRVATGWNMPAQVKQSMQSRNVAGSALDRSLASIANYGHNLTRALYRKGASVNSVNGEVVLDPTGRPTILAERDLGRIIHSAAIETSQAFSALAALDRVPAPLQTSRASSRDLGSCSGSERWIHKSGSRHSTIRSRTQSDECGNPGLHLDASGRGARRRIRPRHFRTHE